MKGVMVTPVWVQSFRAGGNRLHNKYRMKPGKWTLIEDIGDLDYLLNSTNGVILKERPELGLRYYRCIAERSAVVKVPGGRPEGVTYRTGEVVIADGVLHRKLRDDRRFVPVKAVEILERMPTLRILVVRGGGLGDIFLSLPAIETLRNRYPDVDVHYATAPGNKRIIEHNPLVNGVYDLFEAYEHGPFGLVVDLSWWVEGAPGNDKIHRSDLFAKAFGIDYVDSYRFDYYVTEEDREWANQFVGDGPPVIGLQVQGSINRRTPPLSWGRMMTHILRDNGYRVAVFGEVYSSEWEQEWCLNLTGCPPLWKVMAVLDRCRGVISGDSGILHAANALGVPTVGIFGPIDPDLRVREQPRCRTVTGNEAAKCPPCNDHQLHQCEGYPPCMQLIKHDEVLAALESAINGN